MKQLIKIEYILFYPIFAMNDKLLVYLKSKKCSKTMQNQIKLTGEIFFFFVYGLYSWDSKVIQNKND